MRMGGDKAGQIEWKKQCVNSRSDLEVLLHHTREAVSYVAL